MPGNESKKRPVLSLSLNDNSVADNVIPDGIQAVFVSSRNAVPVPFSLRLHV